MRGFEFLAVSRIVRGDSELAGTENGVFWEAVSGSRSKAIDVIVNEPRRLAVQVPDDLVEDEKYRIVIVTQSPISGGNKLLKDVREVRSDFWLTAQSLPPVRS
jgi:hypothetical protein